MSVDFEQGILIEWVNHAAKVAGCADLGKLQEVVAHARQVRASVIGNVLDAGILHEEKFLEAVADYFCIEWVSRELHPNNPQELKEMCNAALAIKHQALPLKVEEGVLVIACYDPLNLEMRQLLPKKNSAISEVGNGRTEIDT